MPGDFLLTGTVTQLIGEDLTEEQLAAVVGLRIRFDSNIPSGTAIPVPGGVMFVPTRTVTVMPDGQISEDGANVGVRLLADDPALGLETPVQWTVSPQTIILGGKYATPRKWTFNAPPPGATRTIDQLASVPGLEAVGVTRGPGVSGVRLNDSGELVFTIDTGEDIPDSIAMTDWIASDNQDGTASLLLGSGTPPPVVNEDYNPTDAASDNRDSLIKVGLYSWTEMSDEFPASTIESLGLGYWRLGGPLTDSEMTRAATHGLEILWTMDPVNLSIPRSGFGSDAAFVAACLAKIDTTLAAYGPRGTFWAANPTLHYNPVKQVEPVNEWNFEFTGSTADKAALYVKVLIASYNYIKAHWPDVTVVGGATGAASAAAPAAVTALFSALTAGGQPDCYDVMSVHCYSLNKAPEQLITESWGTWYADSSIYTTRQLMLQNHVDKPLWITEGGYQISQADGGRYLITRTDGLGAPVTVTPARQAAYELRMLMAAARYGVSRFYWMNITDTDGFNAGWFDKITHVGRPVATTMQLTSRLLAGATQLEILLDGNGNRTTDPYAYRFTTPRGRVTVAWCQTPTTASLPLDGPSTVTDVTGAVIATPTVGDTYSASLTESPIFLYPTVGGGGGGSVADNGDGTATSS